MKINFTKKQYKHLLDMLYLGDWLANSSKGKGDQVEEYEEMLQYVCSFAKSFGYDDIITFDKTFDKYYPTKQYEEELQPLIDENDDAVFWLQLSERLAKRDVAKQGEKLMDPNTRLKRIFEEEGKYETEFDQNGIENLVIKKSNAKQ
ncbi:hypothetical protein [Sediminibacillus massiliensis]|uniref:hypothetical protein n=1 Tax=Sediminibacillus massiliensis TaxID=1926277 RepID=UPI0009887F1E|nr:hypothetical protein [Sediminibacillus massiliensis]